MLDTDRDRDRRDRLRGPAFERLSERRVPAIVGQLVRAEGNGDCVRLGDQAVVVIHEPELQIRVLLVLAIPADARDGIVVHELLPRGSEFVSTLEELGALGLGVELHVRSRSATACAARPSPVPVKPRRSVVVARTFTRAGSTPSAPASR